MKQAGNLGCSFSKMHLYSTEGNNTTILLDYQHMDSISARAKGLLRVTFGTIQDKIMVADWIRVCGCICASC